MNRKKIRIKGIMILGMLVCASLVSASTLSLTTRQTNDFGDTVITSYNDVYSRFINLLKNNILNRIFVPPFAWSLLNKGTNTYELDSFSSYSELIDFVKNNNEGYSNYWGYYEDSIGMPRISMTKSAAESAVDSSNGVSVGGSSVDFSQTNIQVEGVDEPDTVKTDGTYLYLIANSKIYIVKAYPAEEATVLSKISIDDDLYPSNIFINDDRLIVFSSSYRYPIIDDEIESCWWGGVSTTIIKIFDITDRKNPELVKDVEIDGSYFDARMIGDNIYVISTEYTSSIYYEYDEEKVINLPEITINGVTRKIPSNQIYYVDIPERIDTMTHVVSINIDNNEVTQKSFLLGSSQDMYVSKNNIFLAYTKYDYIQPLDGESYGRSEEKTVLHRISINSGDISYSAQGEVPGSVLNQFSMDEYDGFFRIATTIGNVWELEHKSSNNVYILDEDLELTSSIENIAPGERIYSARFMGEKAYLVTFKKVDPFFTLDLSDPHNPKILGKLKIPGYSDYLHPFDENHIIGIGKDTVEPTESESWGWDFAWYQGLKIAVFDVSDFENPKEMAKIIIGDRGTDSPALYDHKAFLFDREKELLVIPVSLYEISEEIKQQNNGYTGSTYGEFKFQGAYVYKLSLADGFELKGRITHMDDDEMLKTGYYWYGGSSSVTRSLYIGDVLYTLSNSMVKMNNLNTLSEINSVTLE